MANASLDVRHQDTHQGKAYRRIELITGEARRRRWTAEEKARIVAESRRPGVTVSEVALRHGVNRNLVWTWRREAWKRAVSDGQAFVPLRIADEIAAPAMAAAGGSESAAATPTVPSGACSSEPTAGTIDIEIGGARVRVSGGVDAAALRLVLTHLGRKP